MFIQVWTDLSSLKSNINIKNKNQFFQKSFSIKRDPIELQMYRHHDSNMTLLLLWMVRKHCWSHERNAKSMLFSTVKRSCVTASQKHFEARVKFCVSFIINLGVSGRFQNGGIHIKWPPLSFGLRRGLCGRSWWRFSMSHMSFTAKGASSYEMWPQILQRMSWRAHWKVRVYNKQAFIIVVCLLTWSNHPTEFMTGHQSVSTELNHCQSQIPFN